MRRTPAELRLKIIDLVPGETNVPKERTKDLRISRVSQNASKSALRVELNTVPIGKLEKWFLKSSDRAVLDIHEIFQDLFSLFLFGEGWQTVCSYGSIKQKKSGDFCLGMRYLLAYLT